MSFTPGPWKIAKGHKRQWLKCRTCGCVSYYDYVPYSLSNPITTTRCGHGIGSRDMDCDIIDEKSARLAITKAQGQEVAPDGRGSSVSGDEG